MIKSALGFIFGVVLVCVFCSVASAADYSFTTNVSSTPFGSADAACSHAVNVGVKPTYPAATYEGITQDPNGYSGRCLYSAPGVGNMLPGPQWYRDGSTCTPPKVWDPAKQSCAVPPPPTCTAGEHWVVRGIGSAVPPKNHGGCEVSNPELLSCHMVAGQKICQWDVTRTGNPAGPDVPDSKPGSDSTPDPSDKPRVPSTPTPAPDGSGGSCPQGTVQAGVSASGTPMCVGMGSNPDNPKPPGDKTTKPPVTTNNQDGSSTSKQDVTVKNSDGSTTTTTTSTTTMPDGTKVVTVSNDTTPALDGRPGKADEGAKDGICAQNPSLTICKTSSVSGTCGQISCNGDAIQCATLRAAAIMECRQKDDRDNLDASPLLQLGRDAGAGNDPEKGNFPSPKNAQVFNVPTSLDASGWLGGGQCFTDKTVTVMGRPIVLPFSKACDLLLVLRYALMIVAALISYRTVSNAVLGV